MIETLSTLRPDGGTRKIVGHYFKIKDMPHSRSSIVPTIAQRWFEQP
jgi:hypothetical protein